MATTITPSSTNRSTHPFPSTPSSTTSKHNVVSAYWCAAALAAVAGIASGYGVLHPDIFQETAMTQGNARGTALVIVAVAIPTLVISMFLAARGSLGAQIVWLGTLSYILYNSIFFAYGAHFNSLFLLYAAMLSLSLWSVVGLLRAVDVELLHAHFAPSTPVRVIASYLLVTTMLFAMDWLKDVIPAIVQNTAPGDLKNTGMVTNPVQVTDFAFAFPLTVLSAVWLYQRRSWGYLLAGAFLVYGVIEAVSVATDQVFGHISDPTQTLAAVPLFAILVLLGLAPTVVYLRSLRPHDH